MRALSRRALLVRGARAALVLGAWAAGCRRGSAPDPVLAALLARVDGARGLGRAYLAMHPAERDADALARALLARAAPEARDSADALAAHLRERNRGDFERGDSVAVDGWILGRSEARLYALAALGAGDVPR